MRGGRLVRVENAPLDTEGIAALIRDPADLRLVWPKALWPFDHGQWRETLAPEEGHRSFFFSVDGETVGHGAIRRLERPGACSINYLFLAKGWRGQGHGEEMVRSLEAYAGGRLGAGELTLVVRSYNQGAMRCYAKCGFETDFVEGTLIRMAKKLGGDG